MNTEHSTETTRSRAIVFVGPTDTDAKIKLCQSYAESCDFEIVGEFREPEPTSPGEPSDCFVVLRTAVLRDRSIRHLIVSADEPSLFKTELEQLAKRRRPRLVVHFVETSFRGLPPGYVFVDLGPRRKTRARRTGDAA